MKKMILTLTALSLTVSLLAGRQSNFPAKFDVVVSFGSMASGPASDAFLKSFVKKFSKKYTVKVLGYKAAGCGREGEFNILFSTSLMKPLMRKKFNAELKSAVLTQEKKNKAKDEHSGVITIESNKTKNDFEHCREGIAVWK